MRYFNANENLQADMSWWNSFLLNVDVGIKNMEAMLADTVADHDLANYIALIEKYITAGSPPLT